MSTMKIKTVATTGILALLTYGATPPLQYTVLVGTIGRDTIAVDRFTRSETAIEGVVFVRRPQSHTMHYKATLAPEGRFSQMDIIWKDAKGTEMRKAMMSFGIDSIRSNMKGGQIPSGSAPARLDAFPLPPAPYAAHSYSILEHAAIVLQLSNKPGTELEWITAGSRSSVKRPVRRFARDTIEIDFLAGPVRIAVGEDKRIVSITIGTTPVPTVVKRSEGDVNITRLVADFGRRDTVPRFAP